MKLELTDVQINTILEALHQQATVSEREGAYRTAKLCADAELAVKTGKLGYGFAEKVKSDLILDWKVHCEGLCKTYLKKDWEDYGRHFSLLLNTASKLQAFFGYNYGTMIRGIGNISNILRNR